MNPTRRLAVTSAIGLAVLVAACGGSGTASPGTDASSPTPAASAASAASASPGADATPAASASAAPAASGSADATPAALPSASTAAGAGAVTASCNAPATATIAQTEGPYYKAGAPQVTTLVQAGMTGTRLTLTGYVMTTDCAPVAGATVNTWQADSTGTYDNSGYTLRGYVVTDATGRFTIETIVPGEYPGRTEHIHVKVTPAGGSTLTTQLYFPGATANDSDGIYSPDLLLNITKSGDAVLGTFTFVLAP